MQKTKQNKTKEISKRAGEVAGHRETEHFAQMARKQQGEVSSSSAVICFHVELGGLPEDQAPKPH